MYARVTRIKGDPAKIDEVVEQTKTELIPVFKQQPGYLGVISVGNRETGEGATATYWDSMENLKASEPAIFAARDKFAAAGAGEIVSFHRCEIPVSDRRADPKAGTHLRIAILTGFDSSTVDKVIERHRSVVAPAVMQQPGALASVLMIDRENNIGFATSSFESAEHRDAAGPKVQAILEASPSDIEVKVDRQSGETLIADLPVLSHTS